MPGRPVARAATSPVVAATGGVVLLASGVAGAGWITAIALGALGWLGAATVASFRARGRLTSERIDPFTLQDPWLSHVRSALTYRGRVRELAGTAESGPLQDNLHGITARVDTAVDEVWQIAKRGQSLSKARGAISATAADREIARLTDELAESPGSADLQATLAAHTTQRDAAARLDQTISDADTRLRLMNARLGEVVSRTAELSAHAGGHASLGALSSDVDGLLTDMEALRQALDEMDGTRGGLPASDTE